MFEANPISAINTLHPQLAKDSVAVCQWALSELRLINDLRFTWLILVPQRPDVAEWFELIDQDQLILHQEAMRAASVLKAQTQCTKINIGALGNVVRQLHVHVIARVEGDSCWPRPVLCGRWGQKSFFLLLRSISFRTILRPGNCLVTPY